MWVLNDEDAECSSGFRAVGRGSGTSTGHPLSCKPICVLHVMDSDHGGQQANVLDRGCLYDVKPLHQTNKGPCIYVVEFWR